MKIIISPAKKMNNDWDSFPVEQLPTFLKEAQVLLDHIQALSYADLKKLLGCNDSIATLNHDRFRQMSLTQHLTPALYAYEGIQYQYMAPNIFEENHLTYVREHLYIISGFYGLLKPFDGVTPYRLEMQAKLKANGSKDLYDFWGHKIALALAAETDVIINLASKEYSKVIEAHLPERVNMITCEFSEYVGEKRVEKGTLCKMARGEMVRFMAEHSIDSPEGLKAFNRLNYHFDSDCSTPNHLVFIRRP